MLEPRKIVPQPAAKSEQEESAPLFVVESLGSNECLTPSNLIVTDAFLAQPTELLYLEYQRLCDFMDDPSDHITEEELYIQSNRLVKIADELVLRSLVGIQEQIAQVHINHGLLALRLGEDQTAHHSFNRAISLLSTDGLEPTPAHYEAFLRNGEVLQKNGNLQEARKNVERAYAIAKDSFPESHKIHLGTALRLLHIEREEGSLGPAKQYLDDCLKIAERSFLDDASGTLRILQAGARIELREGGFDFAEQLLQHAARFSSSRHIYKQADMVLHCGILRDLGYACFYTNKHSLSVSVLEESIAASERMLSSELNDLLVEVRELLAHSYYREGNEEAAREMLKTSCETFNQRADVSAKELFQRLERRSNVQFINGGSEDIDLFSERENDGYGCFLFDVTFAHIAELSPIAEQRAAVPALVGLASMLVKRRQFRRAQLVSSHGLDLLQNEEYSECAQWKDQLWASLLDATRHVDNRQYCIDALRASSEEEFTQHISEAYDALVIDGDMPASDQSMVQLLEEFPHTCLELTILRCKALLATFRLRDVNALLESSSASTEHVSLYNSAALAIVRGRLLSAEGQEKKAQAYFLDAYESVWHNQALSAQWRSLAFDSSYYLCMSLIQTSQIAFAQELEANIQPLVPEANSQQYSQMIDVGVNLAFRRNDWRLAKEKLSVFDAYLYRQGQSSYTNPLSQVLFGELELRSGSRISALVHFQQVFDQVQLNAHPSAIELRALNLLTRSSASSRRISKSYEDSYSQASHYLNENTSSHAVRNLLASPGLFTRFRKGFLVPL